MARPSRAAWPVRAWRTILPPRVVTIMAVGTYLALVICATQLLTANPHADVVAGSVIMIIGCALAAPAAWRGWWAVEGPAAAAVLLGLVTLTIIDSMRDMGGVRWPGWPAWISVALSLMVAQRVLRVWGRRWQQHAEPPTPLRRAEVSAQTARLIEADIVASAEGGAAPR